MASRFCIVSLALCITATPLAAQNDSTRFDRLWGLPEYDGPRRIELSFGVGYALSTDWSDRVALQVFDVNGAVYQQVLMRSVAVAPGPGAAAAVTYWKGRHGFRVYAAFSESCLTTVSRCRETDEDFDDDDELPNVALGIAETEMNVWQYGVAGIIGLRNWAESRVWRPYLTLGVGGVTYDSDADQLSFLPGSFQTLIPPPGSPPNSVIVTNGTNTLLIATDELGLENVFGLTIGAGMDLRIPIGIGGAGLRVELTDQITSSPFAVRVTRLNGDDFDWFDRIGGPQEAVFRQAAIHNWRLTAGVTLELGLKGPRTEHDPDPWR